MRAIRLTFDVRGGKATFRSARRLEMRVPPEQKIAGMEEGSGVWIEVRDPEGAPIYRRVLDGEVFAADTELRTGAADRPLARRRSESVSRVFTAVVPDDPQAASVHILARRPGRPTKDAEELARVALRKD